MELIFNIQKITTVKNRHNGLIDVNLYVYPNTYNSYEEAIGVIRDYNLIHTKTERYQIICKNRIEL